MTQKQPEQHYQIPRRIFKFSDELSQDLLGLIQESLITEDDQESKKLIEKLLSYKCFTTEQELIPGDDELNREWRLTFEPEVVEHLGTLLNFSLMTATNFIDLMRQIRVEVTKTNISVDLTPEYVEYFQNMVNARAQLAQQMLQANTLAQQNMSGSL